MRGLRGRGRERIGRRRRSEEVGDGLVREKGEDAGPLKEDAAHRSQLSHLVLNP